MGVTPPESPEPKAKRIIEPEGEKQETGIIEPIRHETNSLANDIDFAPLESVCGRELSSSDKIEAVQRFNEFISILRSEFGKVVESRVYIKR